MDNKTLRTLKEQSKINEFEQKQDEELTEKAGIAELKVQSKIEGYIDDVFGNVDGEVLEKMDLESIANDIYDHIRGQR